MFLIYYLKVYIVNFKPVFLFAFCTSVSFDVFAELQYKSYLKIFVALQILPLSHLYWYTAEY